MRRGVVCGVCGGRARFGDFIEDRKPLWPLAFLLSIASLVPLAPTVCLGCMWGMCWRIDTKQSGNDKEIGVLSSERFDAERHW